MGLQLIDSAILLFEGPGAFVRAEAAETWVRAALVGLGVAVAW